MNIRNNMLHTRSIPKEERSQLAFHVLKEIINDRETRGTLVGYLLRVEELLRSF